MAMTFKSLKSEVLRRATKDQSGGDFDTAVENIINTSLFRLAREGAWRVLRRKTFFPTVTTYSTGSGGVTATSGSTTVNVTGATLITDDVHVERRVKIENDSEFHTIRTISGETSFVMDKPFNATSLTNGTYSILPQEEYNLPIQCSHRMFMWHEEYGYPFKMEYVPDQDFYQLGRHVTEENIPVFYRMWGTDMLLKKIINPTSMAIFSSDSGDTTTQITIFGTVSGYPDFEIITNVGGASMTTGTKVFSDVDRVVKNESTDGRISVTASGDTSILYSVIPVGDITAGIQYKKAQLYPIPNTAFDINVQYYKDPYRLVNDGDIHDMGQEFDEALILLSTAKIKAETNQAEANNFFAAYKDEVNSLRKTNVDKVDWFPTMHRPFARRSDIVSGRLTYRQAGPYYGPSRSYSGGGF